MVFWLKQFAANGSVRDSDPVGLSGGLRTGVSDKVLSDSDAAGLGTML